jgi:crotonobetainyl-CoA:carnitine CoA-transferase CaiB-like acyl-CoA transferase
MTTTDEPGGLLHSLRILDLAEGAAGFCSRLLADLGASVIKVEPPGGDPFRNWGPFAASDPSPENSLSFLYHNIRKRGITLDIAKDEGRGLFLRLAEKADIVVESFTPGALASLGLSYDVLVKANPRLILVSLSGFGQDGPRSSYASCDLVASAFGGQMAVTGTPATPPLKPYGDQPAYTASLFSAVSVLLALRQRSLSGKGAWIDVSTQECVTATLDHVLVRYFQDHLIPERNSAVSWNGASFILPCRDGRIQVNIGAQWETLVEWMASEGMAGELAGEVWREESYRQKHSGRLIEVMGDWTRTHTVGELCELAQAMRFPWAPVASPAEVLASPQLRARGFFREEQASGDEPFLAWPGMPYRFSPAVETRWKRAPRLGEDNPAIYGDELGLSAVEIGQLSARQVI